jgi:hypothetical protein
MRRELERAAQRAFGGGDGESVVRYPFRYPYLDPVLDRLLPARLSRAQAEAANDLDGLLIVAAGSYQREQIPALLHAGAGAFALLNRARTSAPSCEAQLNLASWSPRTCQPPTTSSPPSSSAR